MCMPLSSTRVAMACMLGMVLVALVMVLGGHESMLCLATASSARCTKARTRPTGHRHLPSTWRRNSAAPGTRQRGVPGTAAVAAAREAVPAPEVVLPKETALTMKPRGLIISIHSTKVISNNDFMISCVFCQAICAGVFGEGCDGSVAFRCQGSRARYTHARALQVLLQEARQQDARQSRALRRRTRL